MSDNAADIRHETGERKGAFVIEKDGRRLAELVYSAAGKTRVIIEHTEVSTELRGTGAGGRLVQAAVEWARTEHKLIVPLCPFAKSVFDKQPAYHDVLAS
jgi:predicted GNAT family acetyltransferase